MKFPAFETIATRLEADSIAVIAFNRPQSANALNSEMASELAQALKIAYSIKGLRVIILTGQGKHFCAGADLKERVGLSKRNWNKQHRTFEQALHTIMECKLPVIAAVNGAAVGGGLELALACDFIYAANDARFALTEATLGIMPGLGGTQRLPRSIGVRQAKEILFSGSAFTAEAAYAWGMVNRICAPEKLAEQTLEIAHIIAGNAPLSIKAIKAAVNEGLDLPLDEALECELRYYATLLNTKDRHEGINAFNEKRKAVFSGK